jgi:hypothetical protein
MTAWLPLLCLGMVVVHVAVRGFERAHRAISMLGLWASLASIVVAIKAISDVANDHGWSTRDVGGYHLGSVGLVAGHPSALLLQALLCVGFAVALWATRPALAHHPHHVHRAQGRAWAVFGLIASVLAAPTWVGAAWCWLLASVVGGLLAIGSTRAGEEDPAGHPIGAFLLHRATDAVLLLAAVGAAAATGAPMLEPGTWFDPTTMATRLEALHAWSPMSSGIWSGIAPRTASTAAIVLWLAGLWLRLVPLPFTTWASPARRIVGLSFLHTFEVVGLTLIALWWMLPILALTPEARIMSVVGALVLPAFGAVWLLWRAHDATTAWPQANTVLVAAAAAWAAGAAGALDLTALAIAVASTVLVGLALHLSTDAVQTTGPAFLPRGLEKTAPRAHTGRLLATIGMLVVLPGVTAGRVCVPLSGWIAPAWLAVPLLCQVCVGVLAGRMLVPFAGVAGPPDARPSAWGSAMLGLLSVGMLMLSLPPSWLAPFDIRYLGPLDRWLAPSQALLAPLAEAAPSPPAPWLSPMPVDLLAVSSGVLGALLGRYWPAKKALEGVQKIQPNNRKTAASAQSLSRMVAQQVIPATWNALLGWLPGAILAVCAAVVRWLHPGQVQWATAVALAWCALWWALWAP